jgi:hypothetical protein
MKALTSSLIAGAAVAFSFAAAAPAAGQVVAELYTSQGCSSCPKANEILGELAERDDVVALAFAVDYWDYRGWPDTFAKPEFVDRQRAYAMHLRHRGVYTPQLVVDGWINAPGQKREKVESAVSRGAEMKMKGPDVTAAADESGALTVRVGTGDAAKEEADVWLVCYQPGRQDVDVMAGENKGKTVAHYNMVTRLERLGVWTGSEETFAAALPEGEAAAVLVQAPKGGPILSAAHVGAADAAG